jgi:hypothetical protein
MEAIPVKALAPPPVPARLREMLKDYPEYLKTLQADLNRVVEKPFEGTPLFEQVIWALEGALEQFISEAREELKTAEASNDAAAIEKAKAKKLLMGQARHQGMVGMHDLFDYFQTNKEMFE